MASTTQNITGIYDMNGGAWEYVMGYTTSASIIGGESEITTLYSDFFTNSKWNKYYDKYSFSSTINYNNRILGDRMGEVGPFGSEIDPDEKTRNKSSWYDDGMYTADSDNPWILSGGGWNRGTTSGLFTSYNSTGSAITSYSYRIVLTP